MPSVSGNLSFSEFGIGFHPTRAKEVNVWDGKVRHVISFQKRSTSDVTGPIPGLKWAVERHQRISGNFTFVCVCRSSSIGKHSNEAIVGLIFMVRRIEWKKIKHQIRDLQSQLEINVAFIKQARVYGGGNVDDARDRIAKIPLEVIKILKDFSVASCRFWVMRNGITEMRFNEKLDNRYAPVLPQTSKEKDDAISYVMSQMYYFLRDIGHRHQHHDPKTDTLTRLYEKGDDIEWKRQTLFGLYRKIIRYKRHHNGYQFSNSIGVLSYAKTFYSLCVSEPFNLDLPKYQDENMEMSINAIQKSRELKSEAKAHFVDLFSKYFFAWFALFISVFAVLGISSTKVDVEKSEELLFLASLIGSHPVHYAFGISLLALWCAIFSGKIDVTNSKRVKDTVRLLNSFRRYVPITAFFILGILLILLSLFSYNLLI